MEQNFERYEKFSGGHPHSVKRGGSVVFSSSDIVQGNTYTIRIDGEDTTFTQDSVSTSTGNGTGNGNIQNRFGHF